MSKIYTTIEKETKVKREHATLGELYAVIEEFSKYGIDYDIFTSTETEPELVPYAAFDLEDTPYSLEGEGIKDSWFA